jgi:hypothetical protein
VINAQPVKPSNGVEGKTEQTIGIRSGGADRGQKRYSLRRGEVVFNVHEKRESELGFTSVSTEAGTAQRPGRNVDAERDGPNKESLLITQADCQLARTPECDNEKEATQTRRKRLAMPQAKGR